MDKDKLEFFKKRLNEEKKKTIESINKRNMEEYGVADAYYTEASGYDNHPADIGTEVFMMEQDKGFKNKLNDTLYQIEESLAYIKEGSYGSCSNCKKKIDEKRLELIPYLRNCIECSEEIIPSVDFRQFGLIEDEDSSISNIFEEASIQFDREDTYQQVASFNIVEGDPSFSTGDDIGVMDDEEDDAVEEIENISQEYYDETLR